jgi:hypothetical protein
LGFGFCGMLEDVDLLDVRSRCVAHARMLQHTCNTPVARSSSAPNHDKDDVYKNSNVIRMMFTS